MNKHVNNDTAFKNSTFDYSDTQDQNDAFRQIEMETILFIQFYGKVLGHKSNLINLDQEASTKTFSMEEFLVNRWSDDTVFAKARAKFECGIGVSKNTRT